MENFEQSPLDNINLRTTFALPFEKQHSSLIIQKVLSVATTPSQKRTSQKNIFPKIWKCETKDFIFAPRFGKRETKCSLQIQF